MRDNPNAGKDFTLKKILDKQYGEILANKARKRSEELERMIKREGFERDSVVIVEDGFIKIPTSIIKVKDNYKQVIMIVDRSYDHPSLGEGERYTIYTKK